MSKATPHKLAVVERDIGELIPYARNARTHTDAQIAQIAASIREFGWTNPILLDGESGIIAGHGRLLAARKLGMTKVPTIELAGLSETQKRAYIIADNKLALNAGWDEELLKVEITSLSAEDFNVDLTGFVVDEIELLMNAWGSNIDVVEKHGENLDGIAATIRIRVDRDEEQSAKQAITAALDAVGVTYDLS